ncbi:MAG: SHOCT domain-containing protein [Verrucomicrobia bacterium]|nr:SHOCT domain-containing protein [Verrucomicrobiota bacterium]
MKAIIGATLFILIVTLLAGCRNFKQPGVVQLSPDTYMLTKEDHRGIFGPGASPKLKTETIREANAFAESMGKIAIPISMIPHPIGVMGDWAAWEYQFRVVDKNDPEARRTSLAPRPDLVIEKNENLSGNIRTKDETEKKPDLYTELTKLDDLRKRGLVTDAEFEIEKQKLLNHSK